MDQCILRLLRDFGELPSILYGTQGAALLTSVSGLQSAF